MEPGYVKIRDLKPALTGYVKKASFLLQKDQVPSEKSVHDIRVLMKKCRAVLKLVKDQIEASSFERDNESYREAGRLMSEWRDMSVHRKTLRDLMKSYKGLEGIITENESLSVVFSWQEPAVKTDSAAAERVELVKELLDKAGYRLRFVDMKDLDPGKLLNQLVSCHKAATDSFISCRHNPKPANIHNFRKRSKDLLYQLWFFRPLNPKTVKSLEKRLDSLTRNLGKHNDLTVLLEALDYKYRPGLPFSALDELALAARKEQEKYLAKAWGIADKALNPNDDLVNNLGFRVLII